MNGIARVSGLLYLGVIVSGMFGLAYVPSQFPAHGDAAATVQRIIQSPALFRLGILADLLCNATFLVLPLALYRLLGAANRNAALLMVAFAVVQVPIAFVNATHRLDVLWLLGDARTFTADQLQAQVMLALSAYRHGLLVLEVFWGLWLLPFGYLVYVCGFLPRVLGVLLMLGCIGYVTDFLGTLLLPWYPSLTMAGYAPLPASLGEIGICLWLLLFGARATVKSSHHTAAAA